MNGTELLIRIGDLDPDLIAEAEGALSKRGGRLRRRRFVALVTAACLVLLCGVGVAFGFLHRTNVVVPSGCLTVGSPINPFSHDYYSRVNENSIVKALEAWSEVDEGNPTIRIEGNSTLRFGIEFVVTFDSAVAPAIPEEERALIAAFIGWMQSPDFERQYECFQPEFVQSRVLDKIERIGSTYEELLQNAAMIYEAVLPFDNAEATFRVMGYRSEETDPEVQMYRSFLERDLTDLGLDPAKIEKFFCFTLADEPVATYDGVFRTDPTDPEIPDRSEISVYRYEGVWYYDPRKCSDSLLDLANPKYTNYYLGTEESEGVVAWVNGSYCRVTTDGGDALLHVNDPSLLSGIAAGDRIGFAFYSEMGGANCTLLIEERDRVPLFNAASIEKR